MGRVEEGKDWKMEEEDFLEHLPSIGVMMMKKTC